MNNTNQDLNQESRNAVDNFENIRRKEQEKDTWNLEELVSLMLIRNVKEGAEKLENHINQKVEKLGTNTQLSQERQDESRK